MRIAVPVWETRVSPVFDTARTIEVVTIEDGRETARHRLELRQGTLADRIEQLRASRVDVLLCGAISRPLCSLLREAGIEVRSFLAGTCEQLIQAWSEHRLGEPCFQMPGCCGGRRRRMRSIRRQRGGNEGKSS